jgi:hypothetical protein
MLVKILSVIQATQMVSHEGSKLEEFNLCGPSGNLSFKHHPNESS